MIIFICSLSPLSLFPTHQNYSTTIHSIAIMREGVNSLPPLLSPSFTRIKTTTLQFLAVMREGVNSLSPSPSLSLLFLLVMLLQQHCHIRVAASHSVFLFSLSLFLSLLSLLMTVRCQKYDRAPKFVIFSHACLYRRERECHFINFYF